MGDVFIDCGEFGVVLLLHGLEMSQSGAQDGLGVLNREADRLPGDAQPLAHALHIDVIAASARQPSRDDFALTWGETSQRLPNRGADLDALLARARAAGEVRTFAYQPPKLSELFMAAVAPDETVREVA